MHTDGGLQKEGRKKIKGKALKTVEYGVNHATFYTYDNGGNILSKTEYAYTTGTLGTALDTITYGYDTTWKDLLTSYDGQTLTSDNIGNLTNDNSIAK